MSVYGIDLGTTNSLIGIGDKLLTGLVPSNVNVKSGKQVARTEVNEDIVASYKTDMSMGGAGELARECSAIVLKELASQASDKVGEQVRDVVISVPAYFTTSQREAVYTAAGKAKLNVKCLINEPTAAAIYLCRDVKDLIVVYDLGGGTFDVSIVDSRLGNYIVVATDGLVVGGDDLDLYLVSLVIKECKIPIRYRTKSNNAKLKMKMVAAKEKIQKTRSDVIVDVSEFGGKGTYILTPEIYKQAVSDVFRETIIRTQYLISRNIPVSDTERPTTILVGGSTNCPYLKELLEDELRVNILSTGESPDYVVAKGVALYAEMVNEGIAHEAVEDVTRRLCIEDCTGKSITVIEGNTVIPYSNTIMTSNSGRSSELKLKLYQGESLIAAKNAYIGTLVYHYDREVEPGEGMVEVTVSIARDGIISLSACEVLFGEESREEIQLVAR